MFGGQRRRLTVRQVPRMLKWSAAYPQAPGADLDPDAPPLPVVTAPDGRTFAWDDPALPGRCATTSAVRSISSAISP